MPTSYHSDEAGAPRKKTWSAWAERIAGFGVQQTVKTILIEF
jgi:hypothetical protein